MEVKCSHAAAGCDDDAVYHADCLHALYTRLTRKSKTPATQHQAQRVDNFRLVGALHALCRAR